MTEITIDLPGVIAKGDDTDVLRELIQDPAQWLVDIELAAVCSAGHGECRPELRKGGCFPSFLEPRSRAEKALMAMIQEAYIHRVSARASHDLMRAMGLTDSFKSQISRLCEEIEEQMQAVLNRPPEGDWPSVWPDATYVKLREGGRPVSKAAIVAIAAKTDGTTRSWGSHGPALGGGDVLRPSTRCRLPGVQLVIRDGQTGLKAPTCKVLGVAGQGCPVHFQRNLLAREGKTNTPVASAVVTTVFAEKDHDRFRDVTELMDDA